MRIWIAGAGAIGCIVAGKIARVAETILLDSWSEHVDAINHAGLRVDYPEACVVARVAAVRFAEIDSIAHQPDAILLAAKSQDTAAIAARLADLDTTAPIVSVQNGLNEETIAKAVGPQRTIGAMVRFDGTLVGPGHAVAHLRDRRLVIGELDGRTSPRIERLRNVLSQGIPSEVSCDIHGQLWTKLIRNCELNALGAATRWDTRQIAASDDATEVAVRLGMEATRVALALGVTLDERELFGPPAVYREDYGSPAMRAVTARFRASFVTATRASMLQDVEKGRPTEVDYINGYVVAKAAELGLSAPLNARLVQIIKDIEVHGGLQGSTPDEVLKGLLTQA